MSQVNAPFRAGISTERMTAAWCSTLRRIRMDDWRVWGALQSRGVTGGGEGIVEGAPRVPSGSHTGSVVLTQDPATAGYLWDCHLPGLLSPVILGEARQNVWSYRSEWLLCRRSTVPQGSE